ncbi:MAG: UDP-forming cellulose synthase catalytic subunit [Bryobacteraceae bacterium]
MTAAFRIAGLLAAIPALALLATLPLQWKDQALLGLALLGFGVWVSRRWRSHTATLLLVVLSVFCTLRYSYWRFAETYRYLAASDTWTFNLDVVFVFLLLGAEAYAVVILLLGYFQSARTLRRQPASLPEDAAEWPTVDVYIPTYNEPLEVVRPTILAALNLDWPADKYNVYVLDDGRRPEFQSFAAECGAGYITRLDNSHAKAGNINHALAKTNGEYVAIFDSDHIPTRSFLQMTMGWFLKDAQLGMLQTPHHFYSPDPFERNLGTFRRVPNEGALFYGIVQDGNDFWNATFFCGSCAVLRRTALNEIGGVAVETVTEDAHTSLRMQRRRWNTAYINIPQAAGLATAKLADHITQRIRWARGMVQILRRENPLFASGLKLPQRLCYFNATMHFLYAVPRLIFLTAPLVYLLLGRSNIYGYAVAIFAYALPHLALATVTNSRIQGKHRHSFWNEVYETVLAPYILLPTLAALINPKWGKFNVTPKRNGVDESYFDWRVASPFLALLILNLLGIGLALPRLMTEPNNLATILFNVIWASTNVVTLGAALAVASESKQLRSSARITAAMPIKLALQDGRVLHGETTNLANGGVAVRLLEPCGLQISAQAARGGIKGKKNSADLAAPRESVVREFLESEQASVIFPLADGEYSFPVFVIESGSGLLRLCFAELTLDQQEALTRIIYGRADSWLGWNQGREEDRPLRSFGQIFRIAIQGFAAIAGALFTRETRQQAQPAFPLIAIGLLILLLFAFQSPAAERRPNGTGTPQKSAQLSFNEVHDLRSLGQKQPVVLRGTSGRATLSFGIPITKLVTQASLVLHYRASSALQPGASHIQVSLNGAQVASVPIRGSGVKPGGLSLTELPLPADLLMSDNTLTFQMAASCVSGCQGEPESALRTHIDLSTHLKLTGGIMPVANNLRLWPTPFFDPAFQRMIELPFAFSTQPDRATLEASGVIASSFGVMADHRGVHFPVSVGRIPAGNVILLTSATSQEAALLNVNSISGPAVAIRDNPGDPSGKVLVVLGENGQQLMTAARALALRRLPAAGDSAQISGLELPAARQPYDAPRWSNTERVIALTESIGPEQLRVYGDGAVKLYFRLPPDLHFGARSSVPVRLNYRYSGLTAGSKAEVKVLLNGMLVAARNLTPDSWQEVQRQTIHLPIASLYPRNTLIVEFAHDRPKGAADGQQLPEGSVLRNSELDLRGIPHFAKMPRLDLFAKAGFPFTRFADLSETAVVLPENTSPEQLALYLDLLGFFGAQTGYPGLRVSVLGPEEAAAAKQKDLLVIGASEDQPLFSEWASHMPVSVDGNGFRLRDPANLWERVQGLGWTGRPERQKLADLLASEVPPEALIQGFASPNGSGRSVVALITASPRNIEPLAAILERSSNSEDVNGTVSVQHNGRLRSFNLPSTSYHLGHLEGREAFDYWITRYLWLVPFLIVLCALLLASRVELWLERHAALRIQTQP